MSDEYDTTRDDWDESPEEDSSSRQSRPSRQPRQRLPQDNTQRPGRNLPPGRRFTPARNTGRYQNQRPPQQSQPSSRSTSPGQQRSPNRQQEPRDSQVEDNEYEQFQRYRRYQQAQASRQQARRPRTEDEEYEQFQRYQQYRQSSQRATRQSRGDTSEQTRRSPGQPMYVHDDQEDTYQRIPPRRVTRPIPADLPVTTSTRPVRPRRRVWSTLFIGCVSAILTIAVLAAIIVFVVFRVLPNTVPGFNLGATGYHDKQQTLSLPITTNISQLAIHNPAGNITITTDANATTGTLTYKKNTLATSQGNASAEFARITVTVKPGSGSDTTIPSGCPATTCLEVTTTIPNASNDAVDLQLTLPPQNPSPIFMLSATTQTGNLSVQNVKGLLSLTDDTGTMSVMGGLLASGSCLQDRIGNITFAETLETTVPPTINPCTGSPVNPSGASSQQPWYSIKTGSGNVDATFNTVSTNIQLDASIRNQGKINSDFPIAITQNPDGTSSYFGPLLPNTQPTALLTLTVDVAGNITLHKAS
ncbi:MAG TPA: hypothetical protein VGT44_18695 [Ktedonobacteraceae bacterium]|nr:hypothetical protein [Ktedonobacteraceae bacterium]